MPHITRIVIALNPDGTHKGAAVYEAEVVGGRVFDLDPRPIASADAAALAAALKGPHTAALAAVDALTKELDQATQARDAALAKVAALEAQIAAAASPVDANGIPVRVPMASGRIALSRVGKLATVKAALAAMPGQPGEEAREWFEYSSHIERNHPTVIAMTPLIGTSAEVDALFVAAQAIADGVA